MEIPHDDVCGIVMMKFLHSFNILFIYFYSFNILNVAISILILILWERVTF